jgi:drug/metabolite transporter (DMT)-like permease
VNKDSVAPYLWMLSGGFFFAIMGLLAHLLGPTCDWQVIALARCVLALTFTLMLVWLQRIRLAVWKPGILWIRSLAGSISMVCTFFALTRLPVSAVLTLTNMFPLWLALLSWPLEGKAPRPSLWLALASGVLGVAFIQQPHIAAGNWATLVALVSSFFSAVAMLGLHKIKGVDSRAIVVHFSAVSVLFAVAALFVFPHEHFAESNLTLWTLTLLLGVGVMATIGQLALTRAFATGEPTRVSVVSLTQIVFAMLLDVFLLGHQLNGLSILGTMLVMTPTAFVMLQRPVSKTVQSHPVPLPFAVTRSGTVVRHGKRTSFAWKS